jgi:hypothetical protein
MLYEWVRSPEVSLLLGFGPAQLELGSLNSQVRCPREMVPLVLGSAEAMVLGWCPPYPFSPFYILWTHGEVDTGSGYRVPSYRWVDKVKGSQS